LNRTWPRFEDGLLIEGEDSWNQNAPFEALNARKRSKRPAARPNIGRCCCMASLMAALKK
jgi:hypothetical protein